MRSMETMLLSSPHFCTRGVRIAMAGLVALVLTACGSLTVTMEVLNPDVVQRQQDKALIAGIPKVLGTSDEQIAATVRNIKQTHRKGYEKIRERYSADASKLPEPAARAKRAMGDALVLGFDERVKKEYSALMDDLRQYRQDLRRTLGARYSVTPPDPQYSGVLEILRNWQFRLAQFNAFVRDDVREISKQPGATSLTLVEGNEVNAALAALNDELAQISIQNSPFAHAVASAPSEDWSGYNKVHTIGNFGSTDVAIKLDPHTGNYLLKGLSFDPSDVAAVASKVATQGLLLAAQVAGVPVKLGSTPDAAAAGGALATSSGALADTQASLEGRRARDQARKAALLTIANVIVNEEADLKGGDAERKAAVAAIRNAFEKREAILRPTSTP